MLNEVILYFNRYVINEAFVLHQTNVINNSSLLKFISGQNISSGANARYQRRFLSMLCSVLAHNKLVMRKFGFTYDFLTRASVMSARVDRGLSDKMFLALTVEKCKRNGWSFMAFGLKQGTQLYCF